MTSIAPTAMSGHSALTSSPVCASCGVAAVDPDDELEFEPPADPDPLVGVLVVVGVGVGVGVGAAGLTDSTKSCTAVGLSPFWART